MNIYESINKIMEQIPAISKSKTNQQQGFKFRGIDDVMNTLQPILAKNKVFVIPEVIENIREERITKSGGTITYSIMKIKYTFYAEDGTFISATTVGEAMDTSDKASNKSMAIAFKYALFQVFCIPTEEMQDSDEITPEDSFKKPNLKITGNMENELRKLIKDNNIENEKVIQTLKRYNYKKLSDITIMDYAKIEKEIKE